VTGRVDDVYLVVLIDDRNILGENRDSPLPFDIVVVEYEFAAEAAFRNRCPWSIILSTSVVLPWSTWAMMAMLRSFRI